ncbi:tetratricopeptide repeat protein [Desulfogranum japonicum]|uniref:tetratricopeptide repeat protein n=1 Tax=Desulfogranum japonicum TaxID=231447 RepID=UPI00041787D0|nr:tetratricopeptide repeat protein [Desulfogranum japonicum]
MLPKILPVLLMISLGNVVSSDAQSTIEQATRFKVEAYKHYVGKGRPVNYAKALRLYLQAANLGDAEAQYISGGMLYKGLGTDPNAREAFKWLLKAARQGKVTPESMDILGRMYLRGDGVPQNYQEAKKWLTSASDAGRLNALNDLAYIYYHGLAGTQDLKKALSLYTAAALKGDNMAMYNVGLMYATGAGTSVDRATGYAWYSLAASRGNTGAQLARNGLMAEMSWEELNKAQALSVEIYNKIEKIEQEASATFEPAMP